MLLDPFEEEFHLPATAIELGYCECGVGHVIGQEGKHLTCFGISIADPAQLIGIIFRGVEATQSNRLITY